MEGLVVLLDFLTPAISVATCSVSDWPGVGSMPDYTSMVSVRSIVSAESTASSIESNV